MKIADLTPRCLQVARLTLAGYSRPEIAAELGVDIKTAHGHAVAMRRQLGIRTDGQLFALAARESRDQVFDLVAAKNGAGFAVEALAPLNWLHEVLPK